MKSAVIAAIVAAFVASGSTYAATRISGQAIVKHSIPANRLTAKAVQAFTAPTASTPTPRAMAAAVSSTLDYEETTVVLDSDHSPGDVVASCPSGYVAIAGGYNFTRGGADITNNFRTSDNAGWSVGTGTPFAPNDGGGPPVITVYVSCQPA